MFIHKHSSPLAHIHEGLRRAAFTLPVSPAVVHLSQTKPSHRSNIDHRRAAHHTLTTLIHLSCLSLFHFHFHFPSFRTPPCTHTHTIQQHQSYILLKRVSEAERPITLTRSECQKRLQRIWKEGQIKWGGFWNFNCKCLIVPIIMTNKTHPSVLI